MRTLRNLALAGTLLSAMAGAFADDRSAATDSLVKELVARLEKGDDNARDAAARRLERIGRPAVASLARVVADPTRSVEARTRALEALASIGPEAQEALPVLLRLLDGADGPLCEVAARALLSVGPDEVLAQVEALRAPGGETRRRASRVLVRLGASEAARWARTDHRSRWGSGRSRPDPLRLVGALRVALSDEDPDTRRAAVAALGLLGRHLEDARGLLAGALKDPAAGIRRCAVEVLADVQSWGDDTRMVLAPVLWDADPDVRHFAAARIRHLGGGRDDAAAPFLLEALRSRDREVREAAACALGGNDGSRPEVVTGLLAALADPEAGVRLAAVEALGRRGPAASEALPALRTLLADSGTATELRRAAALAAWSIDSTDMHALAVSFPEAASDRGPERRFYLNVYRLGRRGAEIARAAVRALSDPDPQVRRAGTLVLAELGPKVRDAAPAVLEALCDSDPEVRAVARKVVVQLGRRVVPALLERLKDSKPAVRAAAAEALTDLGWRAAEAGPALLAAAWDENAAVRAAAVAGFSCWCPRSGTEAQTVVELLRHPDPIVRRGAADALRGASAYAAPAPAALLELLDDPVPEVRCAAASALSMGDDAAARVLAKALRDPEEKVALAAAESLRRIGPGAGEVVPDLLKGMQSASPLVAKACIDALGAMRGKGSAAVPALLKLLETLPEEAEKKGGVAPLAGFASRDVPVDLTAAASAALSQIGGSAVPALAEMVRSGRTPRCERAVQALAEMGAEALPAVPALALCLKRAEGGLRFELLDLLARLGPEAKAAEPSLAELLHDLDPATRTAAACTLGRLGGPATTAVLVALKAACDDPDPEVRRSAAATLFEVARAAPETRAALERLLCDPHPSLRIQALEFLSKLGLLPAETLLSFLTDENAGVGRRAYQLLQRAGLEAAGPLVALAKDRTAKTCVREAALSLLASSSVESEDALSALLEVFGDRADEAPARRAALSAAVASGRVGIATLEHGLQEEDAEVRGIAIRALGDRGGDAASAAPALVGLLRDDNERVRAAAAAALGMIGAEPWLVVAPLAAALCDESDRVSAEAADALGRLGEAAAEAVPRLVQALMSGDPFRCSYAAAALGRIGPRAGDSVDALVAVLESEEGGAGEACAAALGRIGPQARSAVPALARIVEDAFAGDGERGEAAVALGRIREDGARVVPVLASLLEEAGNYETLAARCGAASALGCFAGEDDAALAALLGGMRDENADVRYAVSDALQVAGDRTVPHLRQAIEDPRPEVRFWAVVTLAKLGPSASAAAADLGRALRSSDPWIRDWSAWALGCIGIAPVQELQEALLDADPGVRFWAVSAARNLGPKASALKTLLLAATGDADVSVQEAARVALEGVETSAAQGGGAGR
ncbi:MAG: HEAT repeat domain-containing protein [Planctomycetes bacterium]|nr:HEAT repeat domain-containing protein [Planctomycetota bacterium]